MPDEVLKVQNQTASLQEPPFGGPIYEEVGRHCQFLRRNSACVAANPAKETGPGTAGWVFQHLTAEMSKTMFIGGMNLDTIKPPYATKIRCIKGIIAEVSFCICRILNIVMSDTGLY